MYIYSHTESRDVYVGKQGHAAYIFMYSQSYPISVCPSVIIGLIHLYAPSFILSTEPVCKVVAYFLKKKHTVD